MFGIAINTGTQVAVGTNGYVASFDLINYEPQRVFQVQAERNGVLSTPAKDTVSLDKLFGYPENSSPPDLAFAQSGNIVYVFFNGSKYPFDSTSRVAFWFFRNALNVTTATDKLDIPQEARELFKAIVLDKMFNLLQRPTPFEILETIRLEKEDLKLAVVSTKTQVTTTTTVTTVE